MPLRAAAAGASHRPVEGRARDRETADLRREFSPRPARLGARRATTLEFSFSNPGARSQGLGGAFVGLADDATASFANPAGLIQLTRPEVSAEGRLWSFSTPFTVGGRLSGAATGIGLDQTNGLRTDSSSADLSGLSFLSFVYPGKDWSIAFYRHQTANFEARSETQGFFADEPDLPLVPPRDFDFRSETDLEIVSYGFAGAFRLADNFSLGGGVSLMRGRLDHDAEFIAPLPETLPDGRFGLNLYAPTALGATSRTRMDGSDWTFNAGFLWKPTPQWGLGVSVRSHHVPDTSLPRHPLCARHWRRGTKEARDVEAKDSGDIESDREAALGRGGCAECCVVMAA